MIGPVEFSINGKTVWPFKIANWSGDITQLPPIMQRLRGTWPCVPFGSARPIDALHPDWEKCK